MNFGIEICDIEGQRLPFVTDINLKGGEKEDESLNGEPIFSQQQATRSIYQLVLYNVRQISRLAINFP